MKRKKARLVLVFLLVVLAAVAAVVEIYSAGPNYSSAVKRATNYLVSNYDPSVGLIPETPGRHTYFVYSDNFLAAYVLSRSPNATVRSVAANVTSTINAYLAEVPHPQNQYEVIASPNGSFFASRDYVVARHGAATIETTQNNGSSPLSPVDYADIGCLEALYFHQTLASIAPSEFKNATKDYDGRGFGDKAYSNPTSESYHIYQTYKLAVCDYAAKVLGVSPLSGIEPNLARLQAPDGGFYTGYLADFSSNGTTTNTETTSLAILALSMQGGRIVLPDSSRPQTFFSLMAVAIGLSGEISPSKYRNPILHMEV